MTAKLRPARSRILGTVMSVPEQVRTNPYLRQMDETSHAWITPGERTRWTREAELCSTRETGGFMADSVAAVRGGRTLSGSGPVRRPRP